MWKAVRLLALGIGGGIAAGASQALQTKEFLLFSPVPNSVSYGMIFLVGVSVGFLVKRVQDGLLMGILIAVLGTATLFLSLYLPNIEIAASAPELILGSVWLGGLTIFFLTLIGIFVGRIFSGE